MTEPIEITTLGRGAAREHARAESIARRDANSETPRDATRPRLAPGTRVRATSGLRAGHTGRVVYVPTSVRPVVAVRVEWDGHGAPEWYAAGGVEVVS